MTTTWLQGPRQNPASLAWWQGLFPSVGNPSSGPLSPPAGGTSVLQLRCGDRRATSKGREDPAWLIPGAEESSKATKRGLITGARGVPGSFIRLQRIPEPWRAESALRLGLCGSNSQGTLQVCSSAPPQPHLGTPPPLQRGVGTVLEEGKGGRHDPELSRRQEMSPKRSRGSCIQVLCSVCRNSQPSSLGIPGTARSHVPAPASALGQGQRHQRNKGEPTRMTKKDTAKPVSEQGKGSGRMVLLLCPGLSRGGREQGHTPTSETAALLGIFPPHSH